MSSLGRKIARQNKRQTPEGKEQLKQEKANKQAALPQHNLPLHPQNPAGFHPQQRIRQRRSGNG